MILIKKLAGQEFDRDIIKVDCNPYNGDFCVCDTSNLSSKKWEDKANSAPASQLSIFCTNNTAIVTFFVKSTSHRSTWQYWTIHVVASELNDPICHSNECQIGSFSSEATMYLSRARVMVNI